MSVAAAALALRTGGVPGAARPFSPMNPIRKYVATTFAWPLESLTGPFPRGWTEDVDDHDDRGHHGAAGRPADADPPVAQPGGVVAGGRHGRVHRPAARPRLGRPAAVGGAVA